MTPIATVADAQRRAKRRLPKAVYELLLGGSEKGLTRQLNEAAFDQVGLLPRIATGVSSVRDLSTTVLGQDLALPVLASPAGAPGLDPDGEVAVAKAVGAVGTALGLSSFATKPIEAVVAANPKTFFQVYWLGSRTEIERRVRRAADAGAQGLIVTLDWSFAVRRDAGTPAIPTKIDAANLVRFAPMALSRPAWTARFLRSGLDLGMPNLHSPATGTPTFMEALYQWAQTPQPSWEDVEWLRSLWEGPFLVKSVLLPEDARRAAAIGATAVSVGNHGGNNLDSTPPALRALPAVHAAVGGEIEVLYDGGIRRGSDIVKALALGAGAVLVGRAWLWGLAAGGQEGVRQVFEILRAGIDETLLGLGHDSVDQINLDDVVLPDGFALDIEAKAVAQAGAAASRNDSSTHRS